MPINITMPALSPTMEEGNLAKWLVKEGDSVAPGDVIAEIETDKATMEVEAVDEGTVASIVVPEGTEGVKVNALIAVLAEEGEDPKEAAKSADKGVADISQTSPEKAETPDTSPLGGEDVAKRQEGDDSDVPSPPSGLPAISPSRGENGGSSRIFASPLARRLAKEAGIELAAVKGSGPKGRVVKADIEEAKEKGVAAPAAQQAATKPQAMPDEAILKLFEEGSYEVVPHDNMRKTIARRLVEAKSTIPHFYLTLDCEIDALLSLRKQLNDAAPMRRSGDQEKPAYKISVNDMVIKALALALMEVPDANASWSESGMIMHKQADVGVAVAIPGGLITPIVRKADQKTLSVIANEMKDMAGRARERRLKPEEYQGGTTAVSNLGMYGIRDFSAVINPPHATILAVGAGEERAVVRDGVIKSATIMTATMSTDHRAVDGALGAELLAAFKRYVENPLGMLV